MTAIQRGRKPKLDPKDLRIHELESKLAKARELGATHCFNAADPDAIARVKEATGGGVDYAFEMAGNVNALELAYRITARGGTTVTALPTNRKRSPRSQAPRICLLYTSDAADE